MDKKRKRFPVSSFCSTALVCMVMFMVTIGYVGNQRNTTATESTKHITLSKKAVQEICRGVDFHDTCTQNLPFKLFDSNQNNPHDMLKSGFEAAMNNLRSAGQRLVALQMENTDQYTSNALTACSKLTDMAINDLERCLQHCADHDMNNISDFLDDLLTWVSGSFTYQQTCLDGLHTNGVAVGPIHQNMSMALSKGMELTINALGMSTQIANTSGSRDAKTNAHSRHLKSLIRFPEGLDSRRRALLEGGLPPNVAADVIVAQDGSGKYKTINEALKEIPLNGDKLFVLYIKAGIYTEKLTFNIAMTHLMVIGDGPTKTKITGAQSVADGIITFLTATVAVEGDFFIAKDIGFENTAGPAKGQAVALRVGADKVIFSNCQIDGYQDSLYAHTYRQFYRDCTVTGTIDFILGDSAAVFQNCKFLVRKPMVGQASVILAQSRTNVRQPTGTILQNCTIVEDASLRPDKATVQVYLGRPWGENSRTIIMESYIGDVIRPEGYTLWDGTFGIDTLFYSEFNNRGPGAAKDRRVKWKGIKELSSNQVERFTPKHFLQGDTWIPPTKIPYAPGFMFPVDPKKDPPVAAAPVGGNDDIPFQMNKNCYNTQASFDNFNCI
ncbi:Pectinesterase [Heracleum sosnowskyi]|uniref:Pectinesterase n=1 Tax=Heracleum sosnowskyi TaxID=360622 RepID=A0AAD8JC75_9APIA|nr:Pectinesterase [Heracleum sosnowskyi]